MVTSILIMLSGLNALIIQKSEELAGPVLASVTLGTFTGDLVSRTPSNDSRMTLPNTILLPPYF